MPSSRPQAAFEPIAPNFDLQTLVETTPNFEWGTRVHCDMIEYNGLEAFERLMLFHVILGGKPLVVEGYESRLDKWTFAVQWLRDNCGQKVVDVRELNKDANVPMTMEHYLKHMAPLTNQWTNSNYKEEVRQRMYLKDMDCPQIWHDKLRDHIPPGLFYLNESTGDIDGFGALDEPDPDGPGRRIGRGIANAGDLMSSLPKEMRAENLMCYIGHEGTYTPAHREMCASLGHNIMVEASKNGIEEGKLTKAGTSIWFMTETKEREVVSEYWLSRLGHDIEIEKHFAQVNAWKHAPFKTYVIEQKPGDFILIPPLAPHQVWNRGTRTMKVAWNRTTVETLEMALNEALFKARFVCRDEQYKNKAIIFFTLQKYAELLRIAEKHKNAGIKSGQSNAKVLQLEKDFKRLHGMFTKVLVSESFLPDKAEKNVEMVPFESNITCSYCRCNIFNRFLTCPSCVNKLPGEDSDTYDICMECYAMGRSCACISKLQWVEQFEWSHLNQLHDQFRRQIINTEKKVDSKSPKPLKTELSLLGDKRTLAQICQVELTRRPWHDITKDKGSDTKGNDIEHEEEIELDINGNVKKTKKKVKRSEKYIREHGRCHVDCYWEPKWKQAHCGKCDKNYCYGNLFRAYDMMPQEIMADPNWECPSCRKICGCRNCRNKPGYKKYTPKGTLLGHNTKAVADARSVESLVDFSHSNMAWIQKAGDDHEEHTLRLQRRRKAAELAKSREPHLGDDYVNVGDKNVEERVLQLAQQDGLFPIDPALDSIGMDVHNEADLEDEDAVAEHPEIPRHDSTADPDEHGIEKWVPEGGIMWDSAHAYDATDAITYVYPELAGALPSQVPPPPTEGYQPIVPGYEETDVQVPDKIEMIYRKRKRTKLDDDDRAYQVKKALTVKPKSKQRKSLVIKLTVDKEKLAELEKDAAAAQKTVEIAAAPVIGSDLQALNNDYRVPPEVILAAKDQVEQVEEDDDGHDDEFTPVRHRDRRKLGPGGASRPPPDADVTRRTTRMQAVTYAEPSDGEEEFNETVSEKPAASKLATMEQAVQTLDGNADGLAQSLSERHHARINGTHTSKKPANSGTTQPDIQLTNKASRSQLVAPQIKPHFTAVRLGSPAGSTTSSDSHSTNLSQLSSQISAKAAANRRARMDVIEADDFNNDDSSKIYSDQEKTEETFPLPPAKRLVGSKAPHPCLPVMTMVKKLPQPTKPPLKSVSMQKVSAADWSDDSSSDNDDVIPYNKATMMRAPAGSTAVNGKSKNAPAVPKKKPGRSGKVA